MKDEQFNIENFVQSVREFCEWAETDPCEPSKEIKTALRLLARLHLNVLQFSETNNGEDIKINKVSYEDWKKVFTRFGSFPIQHYSVVFDPLRVPAEEPVIANIADDLADIYRDLKEGLSLYDAGHEKEAMWE